MAGSTLPPVAPPSADSPTVSLATDSPTPPARTPEHQFIPGTRFGDRYRIIELLGCGGMGEVYRADDLHLGQSVALKFLPGRVSDDPAALARLRNEVRVARQISHGNVCRVYDIGEADGFLFLSMEYIDGEDLGSVLRRLGRPTREKALEIARQLCAGLASAHEAGVLHRDLKPDNVMIDGRGRVRITDFGLAAFAREIDVAGHAGTPSYMAPELFRGAAASARTDLFSLGAVLYELFTGRRAFRADTVSGIRKLHAEGSLRRLSEFVPDIEPVVEEIVLRCLDSNSSRRPLSALAVAAALPGQDLVAAALAAGQTPSPEMVAAAGGMGALRPSVAIVCLVSILAGILLIARLNHRVSLHGLAPPATPAVVLASQAREILVRLGHTDPPADLAYGWESYGGYLEHIVRSDDGADRWSGLAGRRPPVWWMWYRESPVLLVPRNSRHEIGFHDPPPGVPGMAGLKLDDRGRLAVLRIAPPQVSEIEAEGSTADYDWLFEAAGLRRSDFTEVRPAWTPPDYADTRNAWTGHYPEQPDWPLRVEAASYAGRPVYFNVLETFDEPWTGPGANTLSVVESSTLWVELALLLVALVVPPVVARRNLRRGTGDRVGAVRLGVALWAVGLVYWFLSADHTSQVRPEAEMFLVGLGMSVLIGIWGALVYLGLEPYVRRLLPDVLIAWSRLLMGRISDPRVGRDVLIGALAGVLVIVVQRLSWLAPGWLGAAPHPPYSLPGAALEGGRKAWSVFIDPSSLSGPLLVLLTLTALLYVLRRRWLAVIGTFLVFSVSDGQFAAADSTTLMLTIAVQAVLIWSIVLFTLMRFGLLSIFAAFLFFNVLQNWPLTLDTSVWFGGTSFAGLVVLAAIAALALRTSLGRGNTAFST